MRARAKPIHTTRITQIWVHVLAIVSRQTGIKIHIKESKHSFLSRPRRPESLLRINLIGPNLIGQNYKWNYSHARLQTHKHENVQLLCKIKGMKCACSSPVQFTLFLCTSLLHNIFHSQRKSFYDFFRDSIFGDFLFILLTIFACIVSAKFLNCNIYMAHGHKLQRFRAREVCFLFNCT